MKTLSITVELTEQEAKDFAIFIKHFDYMDIKNAIRAGDSDMAGSIRNAIEKVHKAFEDAGCTDTSPHGVNRR